MSLMSDIGTAVKAKLDLKVDKIAGKGLSTEDYSTAEKTKLAGIAAGAQVNIATDLSLGTLNTTTILLNSSTGTDVTLPAVTTTTAGIMGSADKVKLDGIADNANNYIHPSTHDASIITVTDTFNNSNGTTVQVVLDDLDAAIDVEKGRINAILTASTADKDTFAEIVSLINSVDTTNDTTFAGYVSTNDTRSTTIETNVTNLTNNKVDKTSIQALHATDALRVSGKTVSLYKGDGTFETIDTQDTVYVHPTSGAVAGTYSKVTVNVNGHITAGSIPTMEDIPDATFKRSVRCATTANLAATYLNNVLTMSAVGISVIDGITIALNDRVLVKDQTTTSQNGIYKVTTLGTASVATVLRRTTDADTASKIASALVAIDSGTAFGGKLFDNDFMTTDTLGTTAMQWAFNLDSGHLSSTTPLVAGTAAIGTGTAVARADHVHPVQTTITGNAGTATTLQTARTINGVSFNGSDNITVSDSTAVKLTGNQTIEDVKTFTSSPIVPTPTTDTQVANKTYVDTQTTEAKAWLAITNKPETATRWPTFAEVTDKPATFTPPSATQTVIGGAKMHIASGILYIVTT